LFEKNTRPATPSTYHPLLHPTITPSLRYILLSIYDTTITIIMILHIFIFCSLIAPLMAFCYTRAVAFYPDWALPRVEGCSESLDPEKPANCRIINMRERCERMNWNIHGAGGFSSAVAAILASVHVAALLCRTVEMCVIWYVMAKGKVKAKRRKRENMESERDWEKPPRDVDIHTRDTAKTGPGRLTIVSEEEHDTGRNVTQRQKKNRNTTEIEQSTTGSGALGTLGDILLECLVP
jgi:hypothetical protein